MEKGMAESYAAGVAADRVNQTTSTIFFDRGMIKSKQVLLKIAEAVMNLIGIICVATAFNPYVSQASFFEFTASTGIIIAIILGVLYVLHIREKVAQLLRLNFVECVYSAVWCFFFFAASTACVVHGSSFVNQQGLIAAGFFGYLSMVLYGVDAFFMFHAWRTGQMAAAQQTTEQVTTPAY